MIKKIIFYKDNKRVQVPITAKRNVRFYAKESGKSIDKTKGLSEVAFILSVSSKDSLQYRNAVSKYLQLLKGSLDMTSNYTSPQSHTGSLCNP